MRQHYTLQKYAAALYMSTVCSAHFSNMRQHYTRQQCVVQTSAVCGSTTHCSTTHSSSMRQHYTRQQCVVQTSTVCDSTAHCSSMYTLQQYAAALHTPAVCGSTAHSSSMRQHYTLKHYVLHTPAVCHEGMCSPCDEWHAMCDEWHAVTSGMLCVFMVRTNSHTPSTAMRTTHYTLTR